MGDSESPVPRPMVDVWARRDRAERAARRARIWPAGQDEREQWRGERGLAVVPGGLDLPDDDVDLSGQLLIDSPRALVW